MRNTNVEDLATKLQNRLPMNLATQYCIDILNESYMWVEQNGAFKWAQRLILVTMLQNTYWIDLTGTSASLPDAPDSLDMSQVDIGKPLYAWMSPLTDLRVPIPYKPASELGLHQLYNNTPIPGVFSIFTILFKPDTGFYQLRFAPSSAFVTAVSGQNYAIQYHQIPQTVKTGSAFPWPDQLDVALLDLAETEIRRRYGLAGWDTAQKKAQASMMLLADPYRSEDLAKGVNEQAKETQEATLYREQ